MKILVVIPAKSKSKRLPNKNILKLDNKYLLNWSIDFAKKIPFICDILVSTDSKKIGIIANKQGAFFPWIRPKKLNLDKSSSFDAAIHAVNWYEKNIQRVNGVLLLQPTSPFRRLKTIKKGISVFNKDIYDSIIGVEKCRHNSNNMFRFSRKKHRRLKNLYKKTENIYRTNGSYFLSSPEKLNKYKSFYNNNMYPLVCERFAESIDIDTLDDWDVAKKLVNTKLNA